MEVQDVLRPWPMTALVACEAAHVSPSSHAQLAKWGLYIQYYTAHK